MPSNLQVKKSIKVIFKDLNLLKGFAVRSRRPANNASDMAQTFLPLVQSVAGAIPIAGHPLQAAISGLLSILQLMDRRSQNKADLDRLASRLDRLCLHLYNAPITQDPLEQRRRDSIIGILQETSTQLTTLQKRRPEYASVSQAITTCSNDIDRYLLESLWSFQMQQSQTAQEPAVTQFTAAVVLGCVTLVDATGYTHTIPVTVCTSFQQFNEMLKVLFKRDSIEAQLQRRYMEQGQYDLCIDDDKQVTRLTSHEWPSIEAGTTIVMRVIFEKESYKVQHKCHFCSAVNHIDAKYSLAGSSINCRVCKRRFQISRDSSFAKRCTLFATFTYSRLASTALSIPGMLFGGGFFGMLIGILGLLIGIGGGLKLIGGKLGLKLIIMMIFPAATTRKRVTSMLAMLRQRAIFIGMGFSAMDYQYPYKQVTFHPHTMQNTGATASRRLKLTMARIMKIARTGRILRRRIDY